MRSLMGRGGGGNLKVAINEKHQTHEVNLISRWFWCSGAKQPLVDFVLVRVVVGADTRLVFAGVDLLLVTIRISVFICLTLRLTLSLTLSLAR